VKSSSFYLVLVFCFAVACVSSPVNAQPTIVRAKQGFSMRVNFDNRGVFGKPVYPDPILPESLGIEYPIGQRFEHIYGGGLWIGGKLDTSISGTGQRIKVVSTAFEGWAGPLFEFFPGSSASDSIWKAYGRTAPKPAGWDVYWGTSLPYHPVADQNFYCTYSDYLSRPSGHIPMQVKVIQSSYAWDSSSAEAIHIIEYKIMNNGTRLLDSAYIGVFVDGDVGPIDTLNYYTRNYSAYLPSLNTAYIHNPIHTSSTPIGSTSIYVSVVSRSAKSQP